MKHTPCQHDLHDHNVMIVQQVLPFSSHLRPIRLRRYRLDSGKEPVPSVPLSGPKLSIGSRKLDTVIPLVEGLGTHR